MSVPAIPGTVRPQEKSIRRRGKNVGREEVFGHPVEVWPGYLGSAGQTARCLTPKLFI